MWIILEAWRNDRYPHNRWTFIKRFVVYTTTHTRFRHYEEEHKRIFRPFCRILNFFLRRSYVLPYSIPMVFHKKLKKRQLLSTTDWIGWNSTSQAAWYIRHVRFTKVYNDYSMVPEICFFDTTRQIIQLRPSRQGGGYLTSPPPASYTESYIKPNIGEGREPPPPAK